MNILITSAGQRVSLVRAFNNELKKIFPNGKVMTTDMIPELSAACHVSDHFFRTSPVTKQNYISELLQVCKDNNISMVVPTIDTELKPLSMNRSKFWDDNIAVIVSEWEFVKMCSDKRKSNYFFQSKNIRVPKVYDKQSPEFPIFIKPYDGSRSIDTFLIKESRELTPYHFANKKLLFMEYIDRSDYDEFTVDMYYAKDNSLKCIVPRKRVAVRSGEVLKGLTCKNLIIAFLKDRLKYIKGAVGCLTLQLFYNQKEDDIVGIEINPRFGGGYPLSYRAGANYPKWLIKEYLLKEEIEYFEDWESNLLMLRYDDEILIHDFRIEN
jgi:carbamoyl-phosphate synthase large subunit